MVDESAVVEAQCVADEEWEDEAALLCGLGDCLVDLPEDGVCDCGLAFVGEVGAPVGEAGCEGDVERWK